jgi:toxin YoeB
LKIIFHPDAWVDYQYWITADKAVFKKINKLIEDIARTQFQGEKYEGIGKPEQLKFNLSNFWSRRIDKEHRLVYVIEDECLQIISCRHHY